MIEAASPRLTVIEAPTPSTEDPARTSPITCSRAGTSCTSAARTAYPSRVARGKGGKSRSARSASAKTLPRAASSSTDSTSVAHTMAARCSTICRASSKLTTPAGDMQKSYPADGPPRAIPRQNARDRSQPSLGYGREAPLKVVGIFHQDNFVLFQHLPFEPGVRSTLSGVELKTPRTSLRANAEN
jgi:hypothetical protein